jgi:hypothetical protein
MHMQMICRDATSARISSRDSRISELPAGDQMITKTLDTRDRQRADDVPRMLFRPERSCFPELFRRCQYAREPSIRDLALSSSVRISKASFSFSF